MKLSRPATPEGLFLWVMHRFASAFDQHAVLKGGLALRLLDSPRATTDIDYVFFPYTSKRQIKSLIEATLTELPDVSLEVDVHSKMVRAKLKVDNAAIQVEANVATSCPTTPMSTGEFARSLGQPPQVVAVMGFDAALSDKLAAWNERRLLRDLYDVYFLLRRAGATVDFERLDTRLSNIERQKPHRHGSKSMTRQQFAEELARAAEALTREAVDEELAPLLPPEELAGLTVRIRAALIELSERIGSTDDRNDPDQR